MINRSELHSAWNALVVAWKVVWQASSDIERWAAFMPHCDRLMGLARAHGLTELETTLEPLLQLLANLESPTEQEKSAVDRFLATVFVVVRRIMSPDYQQQIVPRPEDEYALPTIVMLTKLPESMHEMLLQMEHYGYQFRSFTDYGQGVQYALAHRAIAVVADLPAGVLAEHKPLVDDLSNGGIKWFCLSAKGDFALRLKAVRCGAQGFFISPLTVNVLVDAVDPLAYATKDEPYRVLILDDSQTVLTSIQRTLEQFPSINLRTLRTPQHILDALLDYSPDVLLLDFHMDGCNGLEVARIIRQNKAFESIPIVFLTSETSEEVQLEAMRNGGDDYLTKPISQAQLVNTVVSKAERYRGLRKLMVEDSLTGLYNHVKTKTLLQQSLLLAERQGVPVSYAILDIDYFKKVNDNYGHTVGDKVLKTLARYLKQHVRKADVVGRYGGEEFVVVFFSTSAESARDKLNKIRDGFSKIYHAYDEGIFSVTFSSGVAEYPSYSNMMELVVAADEALYISKREGRNRITIAVNTKRG
ncbi:GGDEF domain-containing response regulator [Uliginosibacterium gangwonense]|uniref:GGDEF domain-containing response regulator n=1 Tax=Uliginosibacterium gangwonense TaxID=392736 RepID=UPI0003711FF1|nr:diguanylate cyclase [Uliginosibacterium gangwonense]